MRAGAMACGAIRDVVMDAFRVYFSYYGVGKMDL